MKSARGSIILQGGLLLLVVLAVGYWVWQRYHQPTIPTYEGKTLAGWVSGLNDPDYTVSGRAADVLAGVGADAVPALLEARTSADIRLHRRAVAVLLRIGAPAAPGLVAALKDGANNRAETALVRLGPAAAPTLIDALKDDKVSAAAARILGLMRERGADAVPALIAVVKDRHAVASLRASATVALGFIGTPADDVITALRAALAEDKPEVRRSAVAALNWIGSPARAAVPELVAAVRDDDEKTAAAACQALARLGDGGAGAPLLTALRSKRGLVADAALQALWQMGADAKSIVPGLLSLLDNPADETVRVRAVLVTLGPVAVPRLTAALQEKESKVRLAAAELLGLIGPRARSAVPALIAVIKDKTPGLALAAAVALTRIDPTRARDADAVPLLADALDHPAAAEALADIGGDARAAVPALIVALKHRDEAIRAGARRALACIGTPAVPDLIDALKDNKDNASLAAEALGSIRPRPMQALPALRQALQHDGCRAAAAAALARIDPGTTGEVVPLLLAELKTKDAARRRAAIDAFGRVSPAAQPAVPALVECLKEPALREAALEALGAIGPKARSAVPAILLLPREFGEKIAEPVRQTLARIGPSAIPDVAVLLTDRDPRFRRFALAVLGVLGPPTRETLPSLIRAMEDSDTGVRAGAAQVISPLGAEGAPAVPALIANLQTYQSQARAAAASALGHLEAAAKETLPALVECLLDPDEHVRYAAALSLGRIDPHYVEGVPALSDALHDASPMVRLAAIDSLTNIDRTWIEKTVPMLFDLSDKPPDNLDVRFRAVAGLTKLAREDARKVVPWLTVELNDVIPAFRLQAATLLMNIEPDQTRQIILAVLPALANPAFAVRGEIVHALGSLGPKAREAVPALLPLLQDEMPEVRQAARKALLAIDPARAKQLEIH